MVNVGKYTSPMDLMDMGQVQNCATRTTFPTFAVDQGVGSPPKKNQWLEVMKMLLLDIDNIQRKQITRVHWCSVVDGNNKKFQPSEWMASWLWWNKFLLEDLRFAMRMPGKGSKNLPNGGAKWWWRIPWYNHQSVKKTYHVTRNPSMEKLPTTNPTTNLWISLPCDFEDSGILKSSSFGKKIHHPWLL